MSRFQDQDTGILASEPSWWPLASILRNDTVSISRPFGPPDYRPFKLQVLSSIHTFSTELCVGINSSIFSFISYLTGGRELAISIGLIYIIAAALSGGTQVRSIIHFLLTIFTKPCWTGHHWSMVSILHSPNHWNIDFLIKAWMLDSWSCLTQRHAWCWHCEGRQLIQPVCEL